jgi:hypothetical protein
MNMTKLTAAELAAKSPPQPVPANVQTVQGPVVPESVPESMHPVERPVVNPGLQDQVVNWTVGDAALEHTVTTEVVQVAFMAIEEYCNEIELTYEDAFGKGKPNVKLEEDKITLFCPLAGIACDCYDFGPPFNNMDSSAVRISFNLRGNHKMIRIESRHCIWEIVKNKVTHLCTLAALLSDSEKNLLKLPGSLLHSMGHVLPYLSEKFPGGRSIYRNEVEPQVMDVTSSEDSGVEWCEGSSGREIRGSKQEVNDAADLLSRELRTAELRSLYIKTTGDVSGMVLTMSPKTMMRKILRYQGFERIKDPTADPE